MEYTAYFIKDNNSFSVQLKEVTLNGIFTVWIVILLALTVLEFSSELEHLKSNNLYLLFQLQNLQQGPEHMMLPEIYTLLHCLPGLAALVPRQYQQQFT
jgi:glycopeptide antibiotics resistance protein